MGFGDFVGNVTGGLLGQSSAEKAADKAKSASKQATKKTLGELDTAWTDVTGYLQPYLDAGKAALDSYKKQMGLAPDAPAFKDFSFDFSNLENSPAYKFMLDQGLQAVNRAAAVHGQLGSGNRLAALDQYAQGLASQEYGNEFNRQFQTWQGNNAEKQQNFSNLMNLWNQNTQNANWLATLGANTANNKAGLRTTYAGARSNAYNQQATNITAANLIPVQEKQNFLSNLMGAGAYMAGSGVFGGGGGTPAPTGTNNMAAYANPVFNTLGLPFLG